jgi:hypothetical protein
MHQDEQLKFHEMSLTLTIPDIASPCRLKLHLTADNRCASGLPLSVQCSRFSLFVRVASVVVCDSVDERCAAFGPCSRFGPNTWQHGFRFLSSFPGLFVSWRCRSRCWWRGCVRQVRDIICDIVHAMRDHWRVMLRTPLFSDLTTGFMTFAVYHPSACPHPCLTPPRTCFPRTCCFLPP